jgi:hypothetical protein
MPVSAITGEGLDALAARVLSLMKGDVRPCILSMPLSDGRAIDFVEKRVPVSERRWTDGRVELSVEIGRRQLEQLLAGGARLTVDGLPPHEALRSLWPEPARPAPARPRPHDSFAVGE